MVKGTDYIFTPATGSRKVNMHLWQVEADAGADSTDGLVRRWYGELESLDAAAPTAGAASTSSYTVAYYTNESDGNFYSRDIEHMLVEITLYNELLADGCIVLSHADADHLPLPNGCWLTSTSTA